MSKLLEGGVPTTADIMAVQMTVLEAHDIYQPLNLKQQMENSTLDVRRGCCMPAVLNVATIAFVRALGCMECMVCTLQRASTHEPD